MAVEVEKVYAEEAEKRMLAGKAIADPPANLPEGKGDARIIALAKAGEFYFRLPFLAEFKGW